jgi:ketosteroid isomerase-like protein
MTKKLCRLAACLVVLMHLVACSKTPDEEIIAQHIATMQEAVEAKDFSEIKNHLHDSFIANQRLNAREVNQLLRMYSMQHRNIGVTIVGSKTTMDPTFPDRAETIMSVVVTGSAGGLPEDGSVRTVKLAWIKQSGDWRVIRAQWEQY